MEEIYNGSHRENFLGNYFEWWYFHFACRDGKNLNLIVHETDLFGLKHQPYSSMSTLISKGKPEHYHVKLEREGIVPGSSFLRLSDHRIIESEKEVKVDMLFDDKKIRFRATIKKLSLPLIIDKGELFKQGTKKSFWIVNIPYSTFVGVLETPTSMTELNGKAYQDHQWGNLVVQEFVSDWLWGVLYKQNHADIFFKIKTKKGKFIERGGSVKAGQSFGCKNVKTSFLPYLIKSSEPDNIITHSEKVLTGNNKLIISIEPSLLMRKRVNEELPGFKATYLRWCSNFENQYGIIEYLRIRE